MGTTSRDSDGGGHSLDFGWGVCPPLCAISHLAIDIQSPASHRAVGKGHTGMKAPSGKVGSGGEVVDLQRDGRVNRGPIPKLCREVISPTSDGAFCQESTTMVSPPGSSCCRGEIRCLNWGNREQGHPVSQLTVGVMSPAGHPVAD